MIDFPITELFDGSLGDRLVPIPMQPGKVRKQHYEYEKLGSCALLAAIEPLTGKRLGHLHAQRTKREYTLFCQALAARYPDAIKIRQVQDNLNTHNASAFYEHLSADEAFALAERFEFIYTPKSGLGCLASRSLIARSSCLRSRAIWAICCVSSLSPRLAKWQYFLVAVNWQHFVAESATKCYQSQSCLSAWSELLAVRIVVCRSWVSPRPQVAPKGRAAAKAAQITPFCVRTCRFSVGLVRRQMRQAPSQQEQEVNK